MKKIFGDRLIALFAALVLFFTLTPSAAFAADSDFLVEIGEDGTVVITGYTGTDEHVTVPAVLAGAAVESLGDGAFQNQEQLLTVTLPQGLETIGEECFAGCVNLVSAYLPDSLREMGEGVFAGCASLKQAVLPDAVFNLPARLFAGCESLTDMRIPGGVQQVDSSFARGTGFWNREENWKNGVLYLDGWAVSGSPALTECTLEEGTRGIARSAFSECASLASLRLPDSVSVIGAAFCENLTALRQVRLSAGAVMIPGNAFHGCTALESVQMPSGITTIGFSAFEGCRSLISLLLPDSLAVVFNRAFAGCESLTSVVIPEGTTLLMAGAFRDCTALGEISLPDSLTQLDATVFDNTAFAQNAANREHGAFYCGKWLVQADADIAECILREDTVGIAVSAFSGCQNLSGVQLPDSLRQIENFAFSGCGSLTEIKIPGSVEKIGYSAFADCRSLTGVELGEGVREIGFSAFKNCTALRQIPFPESLTSVAASAFENSGLYQKPELKKDGVWYWDGWLLSADPSVTVCEIQKDTVGLADGAFSGCEMLEKVVIPEGVQAIGGTLFADCAALQTVVIPDSVKSVSSYAFENTGLYQNENNWKNGVLYIDGWLIDANPAGTVCEIEPNTRGIASSAFSGCRQLREVVVPEGIDRIGDSAFSGCSQLEKIVLPSELRKIGAYAFSECDALQTVLFRGTAEQWQEIQIDNTYNGNSVLFRSGVVQAEKEEKPPVTEEPTVPPEDTGKPGDLNADGKINSTDARIALRIAAKLEPETQEQLLRGDLDGNGKINSSDARRILRIAAKLEPVPEA